MLRMAIAFFAVALLAALFGFGLVADFAFTGAQILCFVFLALAIISLIGGSLKSKTFV